MNFSCSKYLIENQNSFIANCLARKITNQCLEKLLNSTSKSNQLADSDSIAQRFYAGGHVLPNFHRGNQLNSYTTEVDLLSFKIILYSIVMIFFVLVISMLINLFKNYRNYQAIVHKIDQSSSDLKSNSGNQNQKQETRLNQEAASLRNLRNLSINNTYRSFMSEIRSCDFPAMPNLPLHPAIMNLGAGPIASRNTMGTNSGHSLNRNSDHRGDRVFRDNSVTGSRLDVIDERGRSVKTTPVYRSNLSSQARFSVLKQDGKILRVGVL